MACFWRRDCHKRNGLSTSLVNVVLRARGRPRLFVRRQTALNRLRRPACLKEEAPKSSHMAGDKDPSHQLRVFAYNAEDAREIAWRKAIRYWGATELVCLLASLRATRNEKAMRTSRAGDAAERFLPYAFPGRIWELARQREVFRACAVREIRSVCGFCEHSQGFVPVHCP